MTRILQQNINVRYEYPVVFSRGVFEPAHPSVREILQQAITGHPSPGILIYIEERVAELHPSLAGKVADYVTLACPARARISVHIVAGGEAAKSSGGYVDQRIGEMASARLDRHSLVMIIGGGALLDVVGYAASLVHRGLRVIRVPTTVLSQNDGGVGVKTAINTGEGKNFLGTFAPPFAVINDFEFLRTLDDEGWRAGIAEAFKVAMIKDAFFMQWLCDHTGALAARDDAAMQELVYRCAELHLQHIREGGDPFERGAARPLDYGHWSAHQMEAMTDYRVGHGAAVAIGIALDACYAVRTGRLPEDEANRLMNGLEHVGFQLWHDAMEDADTLLAGLDRFREHLGGRLCITLPSGGGSRVEISEVDDSIMRACLRELAARAHAAPCT